MKPTQGRWSKDQRPLYFSAGHVSWIPPLCRNALVATNDLENAGTVKALETLLEQPDVRVLLDSGIFNLTNQHAHHHGMRMDEALAIPPDAIDGFAGLFDRYCKVVAEYGDSLWGFIELDQGGRDNKRRTRNRLHDLGINPIPVYHPLIDGWEYFDELAENYDRICVGNVVQAPMSVRIRIFHTIWERKRAYPHLWVHLLGVTASELLLTCPPDSCDSSTALNGLRYPKVDMGYGMMKRLGHCGRQWLYAQPSRPGATHADAVRAYGDEIEWQNVQWRDIERDLATELELDHLPAPDEREAMRR